MSATKQATAAVLFSEFKGTVEDFMRTLAYDQSPSGQRDMQNDRCLLVLLQDALRTRVWCGPGHYDFRVEDASVEALSDSQIEAAILVGRERRLFSPGWQLMGSADEELRDRLDKHFASAQGRRVEHDRLEAEAAARRAAQETKNYLGELGAQVLQARAIRDSAQTEVDRLESLFAAETERLGVEASQ